MVQSVEKSLQDLEQRFRILVGLPPIAGGAPASIEYTLERILSIVSNWTPVSEGGGGESNLLVLGPFSFDWEDDLASGFGVGAVGVLPAGCIVFGVYTKIITSFAVVGAEAEIQVYAGLVSGQWGKLLVTIGAPTIISSENDEAIQSQILVGGSSPLIIGQFVRTKVDSQLVLYADWDGGPPTAGEGEIYVLAAVPA